MLSWVSQPAHTSLSTEPVTWAVSARIVSAPVSNLQFPSRPCSSQSLSEYASLCLSHSHKNTHRQSKTKKWNKSTMLCTWKTMRRNGFSKERQASEYTKEKKLYLKTGTFNTYLKRMENGTVVFTTSEVTKCSQTLFLRSFKDRKRKKWAYEDTMQQTWAPTHVNPFWQGWFFSFDIQFWNVGKNLVE